jgi:hypothetical protein
MMRFVIDCKTLTYRDKEYVIKGLKAYMELFDKDAKVSIEGSKR